MGFFDTEKFQTIESDLQFQRWQYSLIAILNPRTNSLNWRYLDMALFCPKKQGNSMTLLGIGFPIVTRRLDML